MRARPRLASSSASQPPDELPTRCTESPRGVKLGIDGGRLPRDRGSSPGLPGGLPEAGQVQGQHLAGAL